MMIFCNSLQEGVAAEKSLTISSLSYFLRKNLKKTLAEGQFWWGAKALKRYQRRSKISLSNLEIYC